jgi:hypothetical protein
MLSGVDAEGAAGPAAPGTGAISGTAAGAVEATSGIVATSEVSDATTSGAGVTSGRMAVASTVSVTLSVVVVSLLVSAVVASDSVPTVSAAASFGLSADGCSESCEVSPVVPWDFASVVSQVSFCCGVLSFARLA